MMLIVFVMLHGQSLEHLVLLVVVLLIVEAVVIGGIGGGGVVVVQIRGLVDLRALVVEGGLLGMVILLLVLGQIGHLVLLAMVLLGTVIQERFHMVLFRLFMMDFRLTVVCRDTIVGLDVIVETRGDAVFIFMPILMVDLHLRLLMMKSQIVIEMMLGISLGLGFSRGLGIGSGHGNGGKQQGNNDLKIKMFI